MKKDELKEEKSHIETRDAWNRTFYGSPTIGGLIVIGLIVAFIIYNIFSN